MPSGADRNYRKTYWPLALWIIGLCALLSLSSVLLGDILSEANATRISLLLTLAALDALMLIIHFGEYAYWINGGPTFEQARDATSEQRRNYTRPHLYIFVRASAIAAVELMISWTLDLPSPLDIAAFCVILVVAAFRTLPIRFS